ncbi:MAG: hypothetical protein O9972_39810 [Burkholderiales bacterium]|nr:hypothetical protein [Burkholderiales bacterium]
MSDLIKKFEDDSLDAICEVIGAPREYNNGKSAMRDWFLRRLRNCGFPLSFQARVKPWLDACFGAEIAIDKVERNYRFLEEALELVQATGLNRDEAHRLVDYVFNREPGDPRQEAGGVMTTLAALCLAHHLDMHECGEIELARVWTKVDQIREKQKNKPRHSPLPGDSEADRVMVDVLAERRRQVAVEGWVPAHDDTHAGGEMARAAAIYAMPPDYREMDAGHIGGMHFKEPRPRFWPWSLAWWKPTTRRRDLVKAGALVLAEIERLDRKAAREVRS